MFLNHYFVFTVELPENTNSDQVEILKKPTSDDRERERTIELCIKNIKSNYMAKALDEFRKLNDPKLIKRIAEKSHGNDFEYYEYVLNFLCGVSYDYMKYIVIGIESLFKEMIECDLIDTAKAVIFNYRIGNIMRCDIFERLEAEDKDRFKKMVKDIEPYLPVYNDDD